MQAEETSNAVSRLSARLGMKKGTEDGRGTAIGGNLTAGKDFSVVPRSMRCQGRQLISVQI